MEGGTGTRFPMYRATCCEHESRPATDDGAGGSAQVFGSYLHSIAAMAEYASRSPEELRWQDYQVSRGSSPGTSAVTLDPRRPSERPKSTECCMPSFKHVLPAGTFHADRQTCGQTV